MATPLQITSVTQIDSCRIEIEASSPAVCMLSPSANPIQEKIRSVRQSLESIRERISLLHKRIEQLEQINHKIMLIVYFNKNGLNLLKTNKEEGIALAIFILHIVCCYNAGESTCDQDTPNNTSYKRATAKLSQFLKLLKETYSTFGTDIYLLQRGWKSVSMYSLSFSVPLSRESIFLPNKSFHTGELMNCNTSISFVGLFPGLTRLYSNSRIL